MTPNAKNGGYSGPLPDEHRNSPLPDNHDVDGRHSPNFSPDGPLPALLVAEADRIDRKRWTPREYTRDAFRERFQTGNVPVRSEKNGPAYVGGSFLDANAPRGKRNMRERWLVTLDADEVTSEALPRLVEAVRELGYESIIHATYSSTPTAPRCRVVFPLAAPLPAATYPEVANTLMEVLTVPGVAWDASCSQAERAMYWPSTPDRANYWAEFTEGRAMDAAEFMAERTPPAPSEDAGAPAGTPGPKRSPGSLPDIIGAFNRVYDIAAVIDAYSLPYTPAGPGRWSYNRAESTGGLCLVEGRADLAISRHANTDPACIPDSRGGFHAVNAFDLAALHLFGNLDSEADRAKGPYEREASQAAMEQLAARDPAVMREYAGTDFPQEPDTDRVRTVIAKTAEDTDSALADWCEPRLAGRLEYVSGAGFRLYSPSRGTWETDNSKDNARTIKLVEDMLRERHMGIVASGDSKRTQRDRKNLNKGKIEAVTRLLQGRLLHSPDEYDANPDILNVGNGVVDLQTGELHPHAAAYRCTQYTPVPYRPAASHEDWTAALAALPAESHPWFRRWVGQAATGYTPREDNTMLGIAAGIGANGKTTLLTAVRLALGTYAGTAAMDLLLSSPRNTNNTKMALYGKRFVLIEELPEGRLDGVQVKAVTGTELIRGNLKFKDEFEWRATHSLIVTTNNLPTVSEFSEGLWRRPFVLEFPYRFTSNPQAEADRPGDAGLTQRLLAPESPALPAVLAWVVRGAVEFYAHGQQVGALPAPISSATASWQEQSDVLLAFASECLVKDAGAVVPGSHLYAAFEAWLSEQGAASWSQRTFRGRIASHGYFRDVKEGTHRWKKLTLSTWGAEARPTADKVRGYRGIRFRTSEDERRAREAELAGRGLAVVTGTADMDLI